MAVTTTPLGFKKPDGNEPVRGGDNVIADNAQRAEDILTPALATQSRLAARIGVLQATVQQGLGNGPGLVEDPENPGTYFMADTSPIQEDPDAPGFYTF